jgi:hypothetical protein
MSFPVLPYTDVVVTGSGTPAGTLAFTNLTVSGGGTFTVGGHTLTLTGALTNNGLFVMTNAADQVTVNGTTTFQGSDESASLTAGTLTLKGNFTQNNGSFSAFAATGTHKVILNGSTSQTVTFGAPATNQSRFNILDVTQAAGGVTLGSAVFVGLQLISQPGAAAAPKITSAGQTLTTVSLSVNKLTLDNTSMVVNEQGTGHAQQFDFVTYQGFPTTANSVILLNVTAVGGAAAPRSIIVNNTTVQTSLGAGGLYAKAVSSNGFGLNLVINGSNDPTGGPSRSNPPFGQTVAGATIIWQ